MAHYWVPTSSNSELPRFAVRGGYSCNKKTCYVGRCYHEGDLLPASVRPNNDCAHVSWAGECYIKDEYEILVGPGYGWAPCPYVGVPRNAVSSGNCSRGEPVYVGRGRYHSCLSVGKVHSSHNCLYIPFGCQEIRVSNFEILVQAPADDWLPASLEIAPPCAVVAGNERDGTPIYVARAMHDGVMLPAKFVPDRGEAYVVSDGGEIHRAQEIEVLCGPNYTWLQPHNDDDVPSNAVFTGRLHDGTPLIVGRAKHDGILTPGLVSVDGKSVIVAFDDAAISVINYEILILQ